MRLGVVVLLALVLAGCGAATSAGIRDEGAAAIGDKAAISPTGAAGEETSPSMPVAPAPGAAFVYLLRFDQPQPTRRSIPADLGIPEGSLRALLAGPTRAERILRFSSAIPDGTRLLGYAVANRTAIVDLSQMPGDGNDALLALYQVVYTVTASGSVDAVQLRGDRLRLRPPDPDGQQPFAAPLLEDDDEHLLLAVVAQLRDDDLDHRPSPPRPVGRGLSRRPPA